MTERCRYCAERPATWTGDPAVLFPRCDRCRRIHHVTAVAATVLRGALVTALVMAGTFSARPEIAAFVFIAFFGLRFAPPIKPHGWVKLVDWWNRKRRPRTAYYERLWRHERISVSAIVDLLGIGAVGFAAANLGRARAALFPVDPGAGFMADGVLDEGALFATLARAEGLRWWAPIEPMDCVAALLAVGSVLWLAEKAIVLLVPRLLGSRPRRWPRDVHVLTTTDDGMYIGMPRDDVLARIGFPDQSAEARWSGTEVWRWRVGKPWWRPRREWGEASFQRGELVASTSRQREPWRAFGARWALRVIGVAALVLFATTAAGLIERVDEQRIRVAAERLRPGLTRESAEALMGKPSTRTTGSQGETWHIGGNRPGALSVLDVVDRVRPGPRRAPVGLVLEFENGVLKSWKRSL